MPKSLQVRKKPIPNSSQNDGIISNLNISGDHSRNPFLNDESLTETKEEECLLKTTPRGL